MAYLPVLDILKSYFDIKEGEKESLIRKKMGKKFLILTRSLRA